VVPNRANGSVRGDQSQPPAKKRARGRPLTSERARALALEREARKREARAAERGDKAERVRCKYPEYLVLLARPGSVIPSRYPWGTWSRARVGS